MSTQHAQSIMTCPPSGNIGLLGVDLDHLQSTYCKVASSRPVYYSMPQYISIKIPLHKQSENHWVCYQPRQSTAHNFTVLTNTWLVPLKLHDKLWYMWKPVINVLYNCHIMNSYGFGWQVPVYFTILEKITVQPDQLNFE